MITERSLYLIDLHSHYKARILFVAGGIMDQPNVYLEAMKLLDGLANE